MPETTPLIKAALNLRVGAGFDVYYYRPCSPPLIVPVNGCHLVSTRNFEYKKNTYPFMVNQESIKILCIPQTTGAFTSYSI